MQIPCKCYVLKPDELLIYKYLFSYCISEHLIPKVWLLSSILHQIKAAGHFHPTLGRQTRLPHILSFTYKAGCH